jgi:hypothetical protein
MPLSSSPLLTINKLQESSSLHSKLKKNLFLFKLPFQFASRVLLPQLSPLRIFKKNEGQ